ncbi:hypothetical protein [Actinoplanes couchii]|uniref:Secreted protein n=1 Tax=Actinoplanes couchii TaxID=403638 RepID=A0ABQ3XL70_9ACTN|nr:hypothetical protein [Actinoplanes couchii]MDR6318409.1 hypothetical protein [Actinoplanes couchii]GID59225.1 hypothetical protein Aco03nite_076290 [Actinoplanes couchii]
MTPVWAPVLAASVAVVGTLAAAIFTQVWAARREDKRRADERSEKDLTYERESQIRLYQERRSAYVNYIQVLHQTSETLRELSLAEKPGDGARRAAADAFRFSDLLAAREDLALVADLRLAIVAREAFLNLVSFRDLVARGLDLESPERLANWEGHRKTLSSLRAEMRRSLGIPELGEPSKLGPGF